MIWIVIEISIIIVAIVGFILYRKSIRPLHIIGNGMDLLKEQDFSSRLGYVGQKDADKIVDIFNKMMGQLKNERLHLREQNQFLDLLIASSPVGVIILDFDDKIMQINPSGYKIIFDMFLNNTRNEEYIDIIGRPLNEFVPLGEKLWALKKGTSEIVRLNDASIYKCTCSTFVESGFYHKFYLIEQMTQEVFKTEKKAYEKVIRIIAHEVNNSMAGIGSTLDTVHDILKGETPVTNKPLLDILSVASDRCETLSNFITNYANVVKIPIPILSKISINNFLRDEFRFFEILCFGKNVKITLNLSHDNPIVLIDSILMEQVMLNIVKNSIESIGDQEGNIIITTLEGPTIEISDNGKGISTAVADKIFTPFFSSKPNGQGIGLIFIREVLQKHNCRFSLQTGLDRITRFRITF
ncbi:MAG: ATP-binding protein [Bacteroidales bacterium]